jgi:hypothetical protein
MRVRGKGLLIASGLLLAACKMGLVLPLLDEVDSFAGLNSEQMVVVGRIELRPPLVKGEQDFSGAPLLNPYPRNTITLALGERLANSPHESNRRLDVTLDKTFFARTRARTFFVLFGMLDLTPQKSVDFPAILRVDVRPGDKAVYIGTIRYHRDDYFQITRTEVVDDYDRVNAEFRKKFGAKYPLRKSLALRTKQ